MGEARCRNGVAGPARESLRRTSITLNAMRGRRQKSPLDRLVADLIDGKGEAGMVPSLALIRAV